MTFILDPNLSPRTAGDVTRILAHAGMSELPGPGLRVLADDSDPAAVRIDQEPHRYVLPREGARFAVAVARHLCADAAPPGRVVVVSGLSGGVGASVLAAALAATAQEDGETVALVDGAGVVSPLLGYLNLQGIGGLRAADLGEHGPFVPERLMARLPRWRGVHVLAADARGPVELAVGMLAVEALRRGCTTVVLDVPRHGLPAAMELPGAHMVALVRGQNAALGAAAVQRLGWTVPAARLHWMMRQHSAAVPLWMIEEALGVEAGTVLMLRHDRGVDQAMDAGDGPWPGKRGSLRTACDDLWRRIERTPAAVTRPVRVPRRERTVGVGGGVRA